MSDEAGVFVHDVGPELRHFGFVKLRLASRQCFEPARPTLSFMLCVIKKERPYETTQLSAALGVAESRFVFGERLDLLNHLIDKSLQFTTLRWGGSVNLLM